MLAAPDALLAMLANHTSSDASGDTLLQLVIKALQRSGVRNLPTHFLFKFNLMSHLVKFWLIFFN